VGGKVEGIDQAVDQPGGVVRPDLGVEVQPVGVVLVEGGLLEAQVAGLAARARLL
jgi:hypothetical protein